MSNTVDLESIHNPLQIACYVVLKSWFWINLIAIFPNSDNMKTYF